MGERKRRLIELLTAPKVSRAVIRRCWGLTDTDIDQFIERNSKQITFEKLKRLANEVDKR